MSSVKTNQPFLALSKICLNNWHYIDQKVLTFNNGINFFTGHSGSGKSTVIDAMQIVLYANTDGRGFFNKAAADDSDRNLIEYLRGMVAVGEKDEVTYLRNKNFSTTIVLEFIQTESEEKECLGVVFDVDTARNDTSRLFFWHKGGILENHYRTEEHAMTISELRKYMQKNFKKEDFYFGTSNERFRKQMYDIYLGGLDMEKFPRLFKRAIPFKMNIKLEDFVKEYICMEQDIHIEDLQESVMQYGRMRSKIEETMEEIRRLKLICEKYEQYAEKSDEEKVCSYQIDRLEIMNHEVKSQEARDRIKVRQEAIEDLKKQQQVLEQEEKDLQKEYEEIILRIADSGYARLESDLDTLNETLERLNNGKVRWEQTAEHLKVWTEKDITPNQVIWDIEKFADGSISEEELVRLQEGLKDLQEELEDQRQEADADLRRIKKEEKEARAELKELKQGKKAYPRELEEARFELRNRLHERCGKFVNVHILADLLDVKDERWHNAVEGYLGNNKLQLIVEPKYARAAMDIYQEMDTKRFFRAAVLDTEKLTKDKHQVQPGALAEVVKAKEAYVQEYINFFLGNVKKCESLDELRECRIGVTPDCMLYQSYKLQHMNPENYTRRAYIGETSMRQRIRKLEEKCEKLNGERMPVQELLEEIRQAMQMEMLKQPAEDYLGWLADSKAIISKEKKKAQLLEQMQKLKDESVAAWEGKKKEVQAAQDAKKESVSKVQEAIWENKKEIERLNAEVLESEEQMKDVKRKVADKRYEKEFQEYLSGRKSENYEYLRRQMVSRVYTLREEEEDAYRKLVEERSSYIREYPNRTFSTSIRDNAPYEKLLNSLSCDHLETYRESAKTQAKAAVEHFKDDFIFKIRSAILEAYQRRDELNRIISKLDFGKDKYQFVITKNKGADGKYYKMFMDDSLQIRPSDLDDTMDNQLDMFTMEHENQYGEMMNELINIFIPPENATKDEMDEAKRNMDKYADYRTYLSFDMQQIVHGDKEMTIGLSKMIKKNSGGEGQNPLYVALLASFAQLYKINLSPKMHRSPTLRLVVLDEAFSKMDAEKVASCISLIRGLGFQAIISATNDKIQNYLENVDKTFVYANPNKRHISIQEFEKTEFGELAEE